MEKITEQRRKLVEAVTGLRAALDFAVQSNLQSGRGAVGWDKFLADNEDVFNYLGNMTGWYTGMNGFHLPRIIIPDMVTVKYHQRHFDIGGSLVYSDSVVQYLTPTEALDDMRALKELVQRRKTSPTGTTWDSLLEQGERVPLEVLNAIYGKRELEAYWQSIGYTRHSLSREEVNPRDKFGTIIDEKDMLIREDGSSWRVMNIALKIGALTLKGDTGNLVIALDELKDFEVIPF